MTKKVLLGITALMTACLSACKEYDITQNFSHDTHYADEFIEEFGDPDPQHDWSMATKVEVEVEFGPDEDYEGGLIKVYSTDPYSDNTHILGAKWIDSSIQTLSVEASRDLPCLYVYFERSNGFSSYKPAEIEDGKCKATFGIEESVSHARGNFNTNATNDVHFWDGKVPSGQYEQVAPADAVIVEGTMSYIDNNTFPGKQNIYLKNADIDNMNFWMGVNIYIGGHTTVTNWYTGPNTNVYVLEGAELVLPDYTSFEQWNTTLTICKEAKVTSIDYFKVGSGNTVYNNGTIISGGFEICNDGIVYNDGQIEVDEAVSLENGSSVMVNSGTIKGRNCFVKGTSSFYNDGEVTLREATTINSNNSVWYNRGHYTTNTMSFTSWSCNWKNECYLKVVNKLYLNLGDSSPLPYNVSYVEAGELFMNNAGFEFGPNSQLIVFGTATVNNCQPDKGWGFRSDATDDEWAVFKATKIAQADPHQGYSVSYIGNLIVDCADHFKQGYSGNEGENPYIYIEGKAKIAPGGDNYSIPGSDCNEPYNGEIPTPPVDDPQSWIMACEDLGGTNDYDFNDVVFSVSHLPGENFATIKPLAAGGTLASVLCYKNVPIKGNAMNSEIHYMLNYTGTTVSGGYNMLNTGKGQSTKYSGSSARITLDNPNASIDDIAKQITVHVIKRGDDVAGEYSVSQIVTRPNPGAMPQIILVPDTWIWPIEKTSIKIAYPGFENWVRDATESDWSSTANNNYLVKSYE